MLQAAAPQMVKCRICPNMFWQINSMHSICGVACALKLKPFNRKAEKAERQATKLKLEAIKPRGKWMAEAQTAFNAYIRARDAALPCISCGRMHDGQWHAGHYLSTGAKPELRFDEDNVHKQCQPCNTHLHGNLILYRVALIVKVGQAVVDRLEGPQTPRKDTVDDLRLIRNTYRVKARELETQREAM